MVGAMHLPLALLMNGTGQAQKFCETKPAPPYNTRRQRMTKDDRLTPIRPRIRELQREVDELEWEGLAPEKLSDKLQELQYLQQLELAGDTYVPNF
jgi:hypothetical protein